jgi:glycosyltransferase involved in cell wall biosynthesis
VHIGVDARELAGKPTGVGRYLMGILGAWSGDANFRHRVTLFAPTALSLAFPSERFRVVTQPSRAAGTIWEQSRLPAAASREGVDVLFAPGYTAPLRLSFPIVVAIHDLSFFAHPEWFSWREGTRRRWLTRASARRATAIVTLSEFSAQQIVKHLGVPRDRVHLAPPGAPPIRSAPLATRHLPLVLFVGSLFNRRHIPELIQGFALAAKRVGGARLMLIGDNRTHPRIDPDAIARDAGVADRVEWRDYVDDAELQRRYDEARVFAFLSEYEGFAMTPLEALAAGCPSVLLDTPVAREVYADAATFVPADPPKIADALVDLLLNDDSRQRRLAAGQVRLRAYSWDRSAATIARLLEQAAATSKR